LEPEISFIIPALNEVENIEMTTLALLDCIDRYKLDAEILIVDDCSDDYTFERALRLQDRFPCVQAFHKGLPRGLGRAVRYGIEHATGRMGVVVMADHVDPLEALPAFRTKIIEEGCDIALLTRWTNPGDNETIPSIYRLYQRIFRVLYWFMLGIRLPDITYAYRAFNLEYVRKLGLISNGFNISPEMTIRTCLTGGKIGQVPGKQGRRLRGVSKFLFSKAYLEYGGVLLRGLVYRIFGYWPGAGWERPPWAARRGKGRT
jgi:glycosyltransferase involved in cell wall biosynthesis